MASVLRSQYHQYGDQGTAWPKQRARSLAGTVDSGLSTSSDTIPIGAFMRQSKSAAVRLLGLPVRSVEMIGATISKWLDPSPESDTAWMHTTHFPNDKIRQECIDGWWEAREAALRAQRKEQT